MKRNWLILVILCAVKVMNAQEPDFNVLPDTILRENQIRSPFIDNPLFNDFNQAKISLPGSFLVSLPNLLYAEPIKKINFGLNQLTGSAQQNYRQNFHVQSDLLGYYRFGTMNLNDRITVYSSSYQPSKYYLNFDYPEIGAPRFQMGSSIEVGYKISEKFSIKAGVSVGRYQSW